MADMNTLVRNPLVLGGAALAVVVVAVAAGYFLGHGGSGGSAGTSAGTEVAAAPGVCQAVLTRVQDYGITDAKATLASTEPTSTDTKGRFVCNAQDEGVTYTITVDVLCEDVKSEKCLSLYHISNSAGATLFQRTKFLDPT
jgi:hypothetical protein